MLIDPDMVDAVNESIVSQNKLCKKYLLDSCSFDDDECEKNHFVISQLNEKTKAAFKRFANPQSSSKPNKNKPNKKKNKKQNMQLAVVESQNQLVQHQMQTNMEMMQMQMQLAQLKMESALKEQTSDLKLQFQEQLHQEKTLRMQDKLESQQQRNEDKLQTQALMHEQNVSHLEKHSELKAANAKLEGKMETMDKMPVGGWPWWNGRWGTPYPGNPKYCQHGSSWSHCYTGPPRYCTHGSTWGSCCYVPY